MIMLHQAKEQSSIHLWAYLYVSRPLFDEAQLDGLQEVINAQLPTWSTGLGAGNDETSTDVIRVGRDQDSTTAFTRLDRRGEGVEMQH